MRSYSRLAVIGASGQLGTDLVLAARSLGLDVVALDHDRVEVRDPDSVMRAVSEARAGVVIDCAAFHQVDECERDPASAFLVNALGALSVARAARQHGARTVFISTDYVFDGHKPFTRPTGPASANDAYTEGEPPGPLNVYGASKLAGEILVQQADPDALVIRTAGLFGRMGSRGKQGTNVVEQIISRARSGQSLEVVDDQYVTPTYTADAAVAILRLLEKGATGIVHVAGSGACTWHAFAERCLELMGLTTVVRKIRAADRSAIGARPSNTALCVERLTTLTGSPQRSWSDALQAYLHEVGHLKS